MRETPSRGITWKLVLLLHCTTIHPPHLVLFACPFPKSVNPIQFDLLVASSDLSFPNDRQPPSNSSHGTPHVPAQSCSFYSSCRDYYALVGHKSDGDLFLKFHENIHEYFPLQIGNWINLLHCHRTTIGLIYQ